MTSYTEVEKTSTNNDVRGLQPRHRRMLFEESGIAPEVAAERGYRTISKRSDLPPGFSKNQRRAPALEIPVCSPDDETTFSRIRPESPRTAYKRKRGRWVKNGVVKYEQPSGQKIIVDVHPRNMERVKDVAVDLWITEGEKKADALTSRGLCAVALFGVDCWGKGGELLSDWQHVALSGRMIHVVYDSDVMGKPEVQSALERLVGALEARNATVRVVYLPDTPDGSRQGVDDFLVGGGTVEDLYTMARPFEKSDHTRIRLSRDERLRAAIESLWEFHDALPTRTERECSRKAVVRAHLRGATSKGRLNRKGELVYDLPSLDGALSVNISQPSFSKHTKALQEEGFLRAERPEDSGKANRYIWTYPQGGSFGNKYGGEPGWGRTSGSLRGEEDSCSAPSSHSYSQRTPSQDEVPEFRHSRVIVSWKRDAAGFRVCEVDPLIRLSSRRREILVYLLTRGRTPKDFLMERFASEKATWKNFKRKVLGPMVKQFPILAIEDGYVDLREDWREGVEKAREAGQEDEDRGKQVVSSELKRAAFRVKDETAPDAAPTQAQMDARREEREAVRAQADGEIGDLDRVEGDSVTDLPDLTPEESRAMVAILAFEEHFGAGSFKWTQSGCKELFYSGPISGHWPTSDQLERIRRHVATGEAVAVELDVDATTKCVSNPLLTRGPKR